MTNLLDNVSFVQDCPWFHWLPECTPSVHSFVPRWEPGNEAIVYKPCTNHFTRYTHPLTLLQPQTHTNSFYFSFFHML